jgi:hypothetical protein
MENMFVKSATGKSITLIDSSTPHPKDPKEYFVLSFSEKEAEKGMMKSVPANSFFSGHCAIGNLSVVQKKPEKPIITSKSKETKKPGGKK